MYAVYPKASEEHWSCFFPVWNPVAHVWVLESDSRQPLFCVRNARGSKQVSRWSGIHRNPIVSSFIFSVMRGDFRTQFNALFGIQ